MFRLGYQSVESLGVIELSLRFPSHIDFIPDLLDMTSVDVLSLLGLHILYGYELLTDNASNRMWHRVVTCAGPLEEHAVCSVPLKRTGTHLYAEIDIPSHTFYTTCQLQKLHLQFASIINEVISTTEICR